MPASSGNLEMGRQISLTINGKPYTVSREHGHMVLHEYLVQVAHIRNAKYTCYQGACGACTVAATFFDHVTQAPHTIAFNSCLRPVFACDGWDIVTTEGLGNSHKGFHPIQERLADKNGSQCGWCTPGMVMSMYGYMKDNKEMKPEELARVFDGNTCRCTGYRPIMDAFQSLVKDKPCVDIEDIAKICEKTGKACTGTCSNGSHNGAANGDLPLKINDWYFPRSLNDLYAVMSTRQAQKAFLVMGNTSTAIFQDQFDYFIDINEVTELYDYKIDNNEVRFGANLTLSNLIRLLDQAANTSGYEYCSIVAKHIRKIATTTLRNVGSWAGNLMMKRRHPTFPSDIFTLFETLNARIAVGDSFGNTKSITPVELMAYDMTSKVILSVTLPKFTSNDFLRTFKIMPRALSAYAYTNEGVWLNVDKAANFTVKSARIVFGGVSDKIFHAEKTEQFLVSKQLGKNEDLQAVLSVLEGEISLVPAYENTVLADISYRKSLVVSLFYKAVLSLVGDAADPQYRSGAKDLEYPIHQGKQSFESDAARYPLTQPLPKLESKKQASGEAEYVMSVPDPPETLYAEFVLSTLGNCTIDTIDPTKALAQPHVVRFITAKDIPGQNNCNTFVPGVIEEVLCSGKVEYTGQALGIVLAETPHAAKEAAKLVHVTYKDIKTPILTMEQAKAANSFHENCMFNLTTGNAEDAISKSAEVIRGKIDVADQYHLHMENQMAFCIPSEVGMEVYTTTQSPNLVQGVIANITGTSVNGIEVKVRRIGGGYGAKAFRNSPVSASCGLAAFLTKRPVRLSLSLSTNMQMLGKRVPYMAEYEVGVDKDGKLQGVKLDFMIEAGFAAVEAAFILPHSSKVLDNVYRCDNWSVTGKGAKVNKPIHTACRAPGITEAVFIMETMMEHVAHQLKKDPLEVKFLNMYRKGDVALCGMKLTDCHIRDMTERLENTAEIKQRRADIAAFNKNNRWTKRGLGIVPIRYNMGWKTANFNVTVNIYYQDGSVAISHGGIEMGQGINTKAMQVCAYKLGIPLSKITNMHTDTVTTANSFISGGSVTSEIICFGVLNACEILIERMKPVKEKLGPKATWEQIVANCQFMDIDLTAKFWSCPGADLETEEAYVAYGITCAEMELDVLTGCRKINKAHMICDCGESMNPDIDIGQAEGAFVMGLGHFLMEESKFDPETGRNLTDNLWEYHVPTVQDIPLDFHVELLPNAKNPTSILGGKGIGEPPLVTSSAVLFALKQAIQAARSDKNVCDYFALDAPATVDKSQPFCLNDISQFRV